METLYHSHHASMPDRAKAWLWIPMYTATLTLPDASGTYTALSVYYAPREKTFSHTVLRCQGTHQRRPAST